MEGFAAAAVAECRRFIRTKKETWQRRRALDKRRGKTETDMSGHEETRKKQKSQTPNRNSISHRRPQAGRPQADWPQAGWPQAGWPQAGWPQARGHRPNFLWVVFFFIYTLFVFNQKQHRALNSNPLIFLTEHRPFFLTERTSLILTLFIIQSLSLNTCQKKLKNIFFFNREDIFDLTLFIIQSLGLNTCQKKSKTHVKSKRIVESKRIVDCGVKTSKSFLSLAKCCLVLSCLVLCRLVLPCLALPYLVLSCLVLSCLVLS